jgi:hypothetical protein
MLDAKTCRSHGEHCRELATKSTIPFVRDDLLWLRLAKERERQEQSDRYSTSINASLKSG